MTLADWILWSKVTFDGVTKVITIHSEVTTLDIRKDLYISWVNWVSYDDNIKYLSALRYSGFDSIGEGAVTGDTYFLTNGWKLRIDISKVRVTGALYSDDYSTAYYTSSLLPQYPATVSSLVSTVVIGKAGASVEDLWNHNTRSLTTSIPTASQNADAVWAHSFAAKILTVAKFLGLK